MMHFLPLQIGAMIALSLLLELGGCNSAETTASAQETVMSDRNAAAALPSGPHVTIRTASGERHVVAVEVADTPRARQQGLMHRKHLEEGRGMLFFMEKVRVHSFWMKNTLIPLDILFLSPKGDIVGIVENAEPMTLTPRRVALPSLDVLEVPGGWCRTHAVSTGDRVELNTARKPSQGRSSP